MQMNDIQKSLKERYPHIHPLVFHRSCEKAKSNSELFDMLETMPKKYPIVWDEEKRKWVVTDLLKPDEQ